MGTQCVLFYALGLYLVTSLDSDAVTQVESLWFRENLVASGKCHWDVYLHVCGATKWPPHSLFYTY